LWECDAYRAHPIGVDDGGIQFGGLGEVRKGFDRYTRKRRLMLKIIKLEGVFIRICRKQQREKINQRDNMDVLNNIALENKCY
jgi:hypothetical protein